MKLYFDHASTTPVLPEVLQVYKSVTEQIYMNPGNNNLAQKLAIDTKQSLAQVLNLLPEQQIIYTSGGTESNNLAILGLANNYETKRHFITSTTEHSSIYETFKKLEEFGHQVTYLNLDENNQIKKEDVIEAIKDNTILISLMKINNELGEVYPVEEIFAEVKKINPKIVTMTDAVQALTKVNLKYDNIDLITFSSHKVKAMKGLGLLIKKKEINLKSIMYGGSYEYNLRPGTQDLASQVALVKRLLLFDEEESKNKIRENYEYIIDRLKKISELKINTQNGINIINVTFKGTRTAASLVAELAAEEIYLSTFSACASTQEKGSRILKVIGKSIEEQLRTFRISFDERTTKKEIDLLIEKLTEKIY